MAPPPMLIEVDPHGRLHGAELPCGEVMRDEGTMVVVVVRTAA